MELIQYTAISISLLTQATLLLLCIIYLLQQRDLRTPGWVMIWFCVSSLIFCIAQFISESLRHHNPVHVFLTPLQFIPLSLSITALIQLVYRFPINYNRYKVERNIVFGISIFIVLLISASAFRSPLEIDDSELWIMQAASALGFAWGAFVTVRNYLVHLKQSEQTMPQSLLRPQNQMTQAFNFLILVLTIPVALVLLSFLSEYDWIQPLVADLAFAAGGVLFIYFLIITYLNFSWQRTTFLAQLLGSIIVTQLILISFSATILAPRLSRTYLNDRLIPQETQLRFLHEGEGYSVDSTDIKFDPELGELIEIDNEDAVRLNLPFDFPYFNNSYQSIYISDNRLITFDRSFDIRAMRDGLQPGIALLAMDLDPTAPNLNPASGIYQKTSEEAVVITWLELPLKGTNQLSTAQLTLRPSGTVDLAFVSHPTEAAYSLRTLDAPWLIGLHTGQADQLPHEVNFLEGLPYTTAGDKGIVQDYYIDYRDFLHTNVQPLIIILIIGLILTLGGFPLFMGFNVLRPVGDLVEAVEQINQGNLDVSIPVSRNDEIGFLTDSFNRMVTSIRDQNTQLNEYSNNLENRVIQRTAMLAQMTKQAEKSREEAITANRTKSAFIANITHEIRTPLNAIVGFSDILREDVHEMGHVQWENDLIRIKKSANELLAMINDILDISKIEAGRTTFLYEEFNLRNLIVDISDLLRPLFRESNNEVSFASKVSDPLLQGDYMKVRQIVQNLIANAAKFTDNGTIHIEIDLTTDTDQPFYMIKVRDTGIGMTQDEMERVFEPFQQADNSTTRNYGGSGLGLAISQQYAEMMGGRLWVSSTPGIGSTFFLSLPVSPPSSAEIAKRIKENGKLTI